MSSYIFHIYFAIVATFRKEINPEKSEADNKKHREQVELINDLKRKETKHIETVNRLEKVYFIRPIFFT